MSDSTKKILKGYELLERVGEGNFGTVYRAYQPAVGREVAIKVIRSEYANQPEFIRRFENEAQLVARLEHPHIVPLYDFWRDPEGAYIVMRLFKDNLADRLIKQGIMPMAETLRLLDQMAGALTVAHRNDVIHRDMKPENIMLDTDGNAYLTDFGIAWHLHDQQDGRTFTGAFEYAPPELLAGQAPSPASDIYSLGHILYRLLTNTPPSPAQTVNEWVQYHTTQALPRDERISDPVFKVLLKATAKLPAQRYPSALELAADFREAVLGQRTFSMTDLQIKTLVNPYKGLRAFEESDAGDFFGRESLVKRLMERMAEDHPLVKFLAVVGPSGCGKSSLVKAGLLPALRQNQLPGAKNWFMVEMVPSAQPFDHLAAALLRVAVNPPSDLRTRLQQSDEALCLILKQILPPEQELLLVIDQFEELFTLVADEAERLRFLNNLHCAIITGCLRVIITLRADFYDRPLLYDDFADLLRQRTEVVVPLKADELEQAMVGPAERMGVQVDPRLIAAMVADLQHEPGVLPLLQYTMTEIFERRVRLLLPLEAYQASGGVLKALAQRAEDLYSSLPSVGQAITRQVFLRLVTLGEGSEDTRRRVLVSELRSMVMEHGVLQAILSSYGKYRLLTFDHDLTTREPTIEIAHEALIREWHRLRLWLEESRQEVRLQRLLAASCEEWLKMGRQPGFLLTGGRLTQFEEWQQRSNVALTHEEADFLQASLAERERQQQAEQQRRAYEQTLERRGRTRLNILIAVLTGSVILAFLLTGIAFNRTEEAQAARRESENTAQTAYETALLTSSQLSLYRNRNTDLAIALAMEAHALNRLPLQEYRVLSEAIYTPGTRRVITGHEGRIYRMDLSADGTQVLSGAADMTMRLWEVATGAELQRFEGHTQPVMDVVLSQDERLAASNSLDLTARIWDVATGETLHVIDSGEKPFMSVAFSPDSAVLVTGSEDKLVQQWEVASGELIRTFAIDDPDTEAIEGHQMRIWGVTYSPDGQSIFSSGEDGLLIRWEASTGDLMQVYPHPRWLYQAFFSPDGQTVATASVDKSIRLWDIASGELRLTLNGHTAAVYAVAFTPDGKTLLSASQDKSIRQWDLATGVEVQRLNAHTDRVYDLEFLPGGQQFMTSSYDSSLRLWDLVTDTSRQLKGHEGIIYQVVYSADGTRLISAAQDKTVRLWDTETGETLRVFGPDNPATEAIEGHTDRVLNVTWNPDESLILSAGFDSTLILWEVESGAIIRTFAPDNPATPEVEGHAAGTQVWGLRFGADGQTIFSSGFDKQIIQWDVQTGAVRRVWRPDDPATEAIEGHTGEILSVTPLSDGRRLLSTSTDRSIRLWNIETGALLQQFKHSDWVWEVALTSDEQQFLAVSSDSLMILWDIASGAEIRRYYGHSDGALDVTLTPDQAQVVSVGRDNVAILWDVASGEWLRQFTGHSDWIRGVDFSPTQASFATAGTDATIRLWDIQTLDEIVAWTQANRYIRELTCIERKTYRVLPYCEE